MTAKMYYDADADPSALEVDLRPGVSPLTGRREVQAALGARPQQHHVEHLVEQRTQVAALAHVDPERIEQVEQAIA